MTPAPLIIGGMHRSGTSLTASTLQAAGLDIGQRLMGPYPGNPRGHFEDLDFVDLHREALRANGLPDHGLVSEPGSPRLDGASLAQALRLIAARESLGHPWGFKDPRTVLFLDCWNTLLPAARWLLVFRHPLACIDSLLRRDEPDLRLQPTDALRVWTHYNSVLLTFAQEHPSRVLLIDIETLINTPRRVLQGVRTHLGLPLTDSASCYEPSLFHAPPTAPVDVRPYALAEALDLFSALTANTSVLPEPAAPQA